MRKNILITGADGLVGKAIKDISIEYPEFDFIFASRKNADLTDEYRVEELFRITLPDYIIHTAARVGGIGRNLNSPVQQFNDNILMNTNVIKQAHEYQVEKLIAFSSVCMFPAHANILTEDNIHDGAPFAAHYSYAMAKRMVDVQIHAYRDQYKRNYCSVIPTNIFGEHDFYNMEDGHVVPTLIHKFHRAIADKTDVECWGTGAPKREFIYAKDLAKVCLDLLKMEQEMPQRLIVPGMEMTIKQLVEKIDLAFSKVYRIPTDEMHWPKVIWNTNKPNGQMRRPTQSLFFDKLFPNFQYTPIDAALRESVKWFNLNYPYVRF